MRFEDALARLAQPAIGAVARGQQHQIGSEIAARPDVLRERHCLLEPRLRLREVSLQHERKSHRLIRHDLAQRDADAIGQLDRAADLGDTRGGMAGPDQAMSKHAAVGNLDPDQIRLPGKL